MKKQLIHFGVVIGVLVLCIAGYFLMTNYFDEKQEKEEKASKIEVFKIDDHTKITGLTYVYDGETVALLNDGSEWLSSSDSETNLDEDIIEQEMLIPLSQIDAEEMIESPEDTASYGISKDEDGNITSETTMIIAMDEDDKSYTLYIGSANPYDSTKYYMMVEGDDNVYVIDSTIIEAFSKSVTELEVVEETTEEVATEEPEETTEISE